MEAASSDNNNQTFTAYSAAVHKVICMVVAGIMGLLQIMNQQPTFISETHKPTLLCFCLLVFFYAVLRVRETIEAQLRPGFLMRLVGHTSHLFGGLASIVLISMVCATFALILLSLWFLWLCFLAYVTFHEIKIVYSEANISSGAGSPHSSPV